MQQILHRKWKLTDVKGQIQQTPLGLGSQTPQNPKLPTTQGNGHKPPSEKFPVEQCGIRTTNHCPGLSLLTVNALNGNKIWEKAQGAFQVGTTSLVPSITTQHLSLLPPPQHLSHRASGKWGWKPLGGNCQKSESLLQEMQMAPGQAQQSCQKGDSKGSAALGNTHGRREPGGEPGHPSQGSQAGTELLGGFRSQLSHIQSHGSHGDRGDEKPVRIWKGQPEISLFFLSFPLEEVKQRALGAVSHQNCFCRDCWKALVAHTAVAPGDFHCSKGPKTPEPFPNPRSCLSQKGTKSHATA